MSHLFISHASEDKEDLVRPLAHALKAHGVRVWYDEFSLRPGDSLRSSIDKGLADCHAGLVVLSPFFFAKAWPQRELDALFTAEILGRSRLIPIWHQIEVQQVSAFSPLLADRVALKSEFGVENIALRLAAQLPSEEVLSGEELAVRIEALVYPMLLHGEALHAGIQQRFLQMNGFKEEYQSISSELTDKLSDEEIDPFPQALEDELRRHELRLRVRHAIPNDVYLTIDEPIDESELGWWRDSLGHWCSGTMAEHESKALVERLDLVDLDEYYILLGVPNFQISGRQRDLVRRSLVLLGYGFEQGYNEVEALCAQLRSLPRDASLRSKLKCNTRTESKT